MEIEDLILHQIVIEDVMWGVEDQEYYTIFWHTDDCLACELLGGLPTEIDYYERVDG